MSVHLRQPGVALTLPLVLGLSDGVLNALVLASGTILEQRSDISVTLGARVGAAALVTAAFTMYVAKYTELRDQLVRASRQLNIARRGHLASTRLGRIAAREALTATIVAIVASFAGALGPLTAGAMLPGPAWLPVGIAIAALAVMGLGIGTAVGGEPVRWGGRARRGRGRGGFRRRSASHRVALGQVVSLRTGAWPGTMLVGDEARPNCRSG